MQILPQEDCRTFEGPFNAYIDTLGKCVEAWYSLKGNEKIINHILCAKNPNLGRSICHADSGGPLTVKQNGTHVLVGITSLAYGCGLVSSPLDLRIPGYIPCTALWDSRGSY